MFKSRQMLPKYRKYNVLQRKEKFLFLEALSIHLYTGLLLKVIPFRWIPRFFSNSKRGTRNEKRETLPLIKTAIQRASRISPWKNRCLVSSLAGRCMLRRRKISSQLSLGVAKNAGGKTVAHAWLKVGDLEIVNKMGEYTELFFF